MDDLVCFDSPMYIGVVHSTSSPHAYEYGWLTIINNLRPTSLLESVSSLRITFMWIHKQENKYSHVYYKIEKWLSLGIKISDNEITFHNF